MRPCSNAEPALSEFDLRELDKFRQLSDHTEVAMARAMDYCATHQVCPPEWLVAAAASVMIELLKREKPTRRGRTASCIARVQHEMWDNERWDAVRKIHEIRDKSHREEKALTSRPNPSVTEAWKKHHAKRKKWLKQDTFECAAQLLFHWGRDAFSSASAIRASYRKMEATLKRPQRPEGAWLFEDAFVKKLGLQGAYEQRPGRNPFGIFDLT